MTDPYCLKCKKYTINKNSRFSNNFNGELMLPTCHGVCNSKKNRQKQPYIGALKKRCFENIPQIYRRTSMPKCDFNEILCNFIEIALWHGCSPVNLLHVFRTPFPRNTSGWLLLNRFIKKRHARGIVSSLGVKTLLSKIALFEVILPWIQIYEKQK